MKNQGKINQENRNIHKKNSLLVKFSKLNINLQVNDNVRSQGSTFKNVFKKLRTLAPFLWPKKDCVLQFRVLICFVLLIAGRGINLYVPIYSKLIGKLIHMKFYFFIDLFKSLFFYF